ncbi:hypothetical protein D9619_000584 [Psilocybe cf. subviscida]|uniref:Thioredoxin domain-containing protein n=1 Tax=Psilocybe cf. subviscida TaxID=2480587 RepID=A0A8H5BEG9_9AGAR|nr:hypothetical protein D9619_000584 [Psilocybe cf. subviscida]
MKVSAAAFALLALAGSSAAQYFSDGWTPGQKPHSVSSGAPAAETAGFVPPEVTEEDQTKAASAPFSVWDIFDVNKMLKTEPAVALFGKFGVNITDKVDTAVKIWDDRIPLITDDNFNELIVNEPLTKDEEDERVWVIVISVTSARQDGISKFLDSAFDEAYNQTVLAGDLPHVRWGRIDYINVTYITTKWAVWQAPYLVILKDRGQTLRFYRPHQMRLRDDALRQFLSVDGWKQTRPWQSAYAPGGNREHIMDFQAKWFTIIYNYVSLVPKWALLFLSGSLASVFIGLLHKSDAKKAAAVTARTVKAEPKAGTPAPVATTKASAVDSERESSASPAGKRTSTRLRKNKK